MALKHRGKTLAAGLLAGALLGGGLAAITPAGAAVQGAAAGIDWKQIWQTKIKPRTDKRYYTKKTANARYYTKFDANALFETKAAHDASLANYYTKAQHDASLLNYYTKTQSDANYYTKAAGDAKYAPQVALIRGNFVADVPSGALVTNPISFGQTFSAAPIGHMIAFGAAVPVGCSGTAAAPNAAPGHLCVFESIDSANTTTALSGVNAFGALVFGTVTNTAAAAYIQGTWAARPLAVTYPARSGADDAPVAPNGVNGR
jgi:hypothetical protein